MTTLSHETIKKIIAKKMTGTSWSTQEKINNIVADLSYQGRKNLLKTMERVVEEEQHLVDRRKKSDGTTDISE